MKVKYMPTKDDILKYLRSIKPELQKEGIHSLGLFGSFAKGTQTIHSDIDIAIKLEDDFLKNNDVWHYFDEINKIKSMLYRKFQIRSDVFDLDSESSIKHKVLDEVTYV